MAIKSSVNKPNGQTRAQSPRDDEGNPTGNGPTWSYENSTHNQTGVNINVGGSLSASAGGSLVAQGVNANVGGATSLSAVGDMQLTTALNGHINTFDFLNRYRDSAGLIRVEQTIHRSDTQITNSGNNWSSSGGAVNINAGGNLSLVGAQINGQGDIGAVLNALGSSESWGYRSNTDTLLNPAGQRQAVFGLKLLHFKVKSALSPPPQWKRASAPSTKNADTPGGARAGVKS